MKRVTTYQAKTHLSSLVKEVADGEEVIICRGEVPVAKLVAYKQGKASDQRPKVGTITSGGLGDIPDEVWAPLTDEELQDWGI
jgi:prevent-host-death family protein